MLFGHRRHDVDEAMYDPAWHAWQVVLGGTIKVSGEQQAVALITLYVPTGQQNVALTALYAPAGQHMPASAALFVPAAQARQAAADVR